MKPGRATRKEIIRRALTYTLMSVSVLVLVTLLMLAVLGYTFNPTDRRLEQGGLLQFASVPSGAKVTVDEVPLGSRTPSKLTADASSHTVTMSLDKYHTWQKTIDLKAGMVGWLSYTRLIPKDIKTEKIRDLPALSQALASPERKWFALLGDMAVPQITIANLQNDVVEFETLDLPAESFTAPSEGKGQSFKLVSWSLNGEALLVQHSYDDDKVEWLAVDRDDATQTFNISARLGVAATKIEFAGRDGRTAFALSDGTVRRLNLNDETISRPLVANAVDFTVYDPDTVLYATAADPATKQRSVGYVRENMKAAQQLGTYADDGQPIHVGMSEYFGKRYVASSHGASVHVTSGDLPRQDNRGSQKTIATFKAPAPIERLSMSTNGRFVIAEAVGTFTVHDLELAKTDTTVLKHTSGSARPLKWADSFMPWYDAGGVLRVYEFDGGNQHDIAKVAEGFDIAFSPNDKYLYSVGRNGEGFTLQRVRMIVE